MAEEVKLLQPLEYIKQFLNKGIRSDGRSFGEFRPILLNCDSIGTANGSALIRLGNSAVICGVTTEIIEPKLETPEEGVVTICVKLPALCSAKYSMNDSNSDALVLTQMLQNIANKSQLIDCKKLCISETKFVWNINIEIICLNNDGNIFDLSLAAILASLQSCSLKSVVVNEENKLTYEETKAPLEVSSYPIATSFAVLNGHFLCDPTVEEESLADSVINFVVNADNDIIHLIHTTGTTKLGLDDMDNCFKIAKNRAKIIKKLILENSESSKKLKK